MADDDVEFVAMDDKIALAVGGDVDRLAHDLDAAEAQAEELAGEFVVVAGHEDHPRASPDLAQQLLHDVVVRLRPVPARAQPPAVDDVADQVDGVGLDMAKHVEDEIGLTAARSQMQVGKEQTCGSDGRRGDWTRGPSH